MSYKLMLGGILAWVLALAPVAAKAANLISCVPRVVGEVTAPIALGPLVTGGPAVSSNLQLHLLRGRILQTHYNVGTGGECQLWLKVPKSNPPFECLEFWIKGDDSGNLLKLSYLYAPSAGDTPTLAVVRLNFNGWRHLEIPASNRIYLYYPRAVPEVIMAIQKGRASTALKGTILLRRMQWARSTLKIKPAVRAKAAAALAPAPVFDTWGGPTRQQLMAARKIGVTLHQIPVAFPSAGTTVVQQVGYASRAIRWCRQIGLMSGLAYYNTPPASWTKKHLNMVVLNAQGVPPSPSGEVYLSPWNPKAVAMWRRHIIQTLTYLKDHRLLRDVSVINLSPAVEGEVSFAWYHVWAFDKYAIKAYHRYLRLKYNRRIASLNRDWGTAYHHFNQIRPPQTWYPDRAHWVFTNFYRLSMLRYCVKLADAVRSVYRPKYWLWLLHTMNTYPERFYSARYPLFYATALRRLGILDYSHFAALNWQSVQDVQYARHLGVRVIAEISGCPNIAAANILFSQAKKYGFDGVFVQIAEQLSSPDGKLTPVGRHVAALIKSYTAWYKAGKANK